ncbi:hypothetical protein, partial [Fulvivirga sp.]|uniref:hypothetical protein n=1 Tax=Fulvivirga sp. TaxID=1931237 RepID=UPI0032EF8BE1
MRVKSLNKEKLIRAIDISMVNRNKENLRIDFILDPQLLIIELIKNAVFEENVYSNRIAKNLFTFNNCDFNKTITLKDSNNIYFDNC